MFYVYISKALTTKRMLTLGFLVPEFHSIRKTHVCHRLQPHLYPGLIEIRLGRDVEPDCDISQRMSSSTPLSEPEIIDELRLLTVKGEHI